jgi:NADH-quinone oxidoreductase subunit F
MDITFSKGELRKSRQIIEQLRQPLIQIGMGTCGIAAGAEDIYAAAKRTLKQMNLPECIRPVGCLGMCYLEPLMAVQKPGGPFVYYGNLTAQRTEEILSACLIHNDPKPEWAVCIRGDGSVDGISRFEDLPMIKPQMRVALRNCGIIEPENIDQYFDRGGYTGLRSALNLEPGEVIQEIKNSGLRGRGGAGFPTGTKWELARKAPGQIKYFICNADEGDPGAFMDRSLLEGDPHSVLEGMLIGAYAIGCVEGFIYIRAEYPLAIKRLETALRRMRECGLLGQNILGSPFSFQIHIKEGAGAFVCGEETALMASIEGGRGMPRPRPPFPVHKGLWGNPTNINNVETLANVSAILAQGAKWFAGLGTEKSKGTKTFALAGKVQKTGLIEVPMGIPLADIIHGIGGGVARGKRVKAVQTGGPSGGCIPVHLFELPVDYESLAAAGSIMGSGGMVVLDEDTCMVDMAKYFLSFTQLESCGKCIPCRNGTKQMLDILEDISSGRGKMEDIDLLIELGETIKAGSLCGLGQTAPNPVLSTLRYFADEYESHIKKHYCPAAVCKGLVKAPCSHVCPAGVDVPRYIRLTAEGKYDEALMVIKEKIPFPAVCGYVCYHPCESKCRRGQIDEPIAIRALKRFVVDHAAKGNSTIPQTAPPSGKHVAVVGSGPAGLTAAYYLAKTGGHMVTIFEALPEAGGMMRVGIPRYRLPNNVLDAEIEMIRQAGVEIKTNTLIDSLPVLQKQGYDAIFLALGAHAGIKMSIGGEDSEGIMDCISFLREVNSGNKLKLGERVAVVGGGNAAIDASRTALRLGAKEVTILYRRTRDEMPASDEEIRGSLEEGIKIEFLTAPTGISSQDGHFKMECIRMKLGKTDVSGRRRPESVPGSEFDQQFDTIITAIGQIPEIPKGIGVKVNRDGTLNAAQDTCETEIKGIFAGGDAVSGPSSVIEAIAIGRQAAMAIDKYLGSEGLIDDKPAAPEDLSGLLEMAEEEGEKRRAIMPVLSLETRLKGFGLVELGYSEITAKEEAQRCLRCDLERDQSSSHRQVLSA